MFEDVYNFVLDQNGSVAGLQSVSGPGWLIIGLKGVQEISKYFVQALRQMFL